MNGETKENLKELFEQFVASEQVEQAAEDVRKGEQILSSFSAPEPDRELIADIKAEVAARMLRKRENTFRIKALAFAAGFILVAVISVKLFETKRVLPERPVAGGPVIPNAVWESDCLADDSAESAALVAEIEQIESEVFALRSDENGSGYREAATELEMELTEINSDFWKG
ncbi:MAG: hypothetical protein JW947_06770 [Sedimentisphaerales bacterium]|nr:hypothetical protein [Sedimentisphaerales bacterium]